MIKRNMIPRTLRGANGERFYDIPGLVYPKHVLSPPPPKPKKNLTHEVPPWGITTPEAAAMLGCRDSSARVLMRRNGITRVEVSRPHRPPISYWHKKELEALIQRRIKEVNSIPPNYISTDDACRMLNVCSTTLTRLAQKGKLQMLRVRFRSDKGVRIKLFFRRSQVRLIRYHMEALRRKE